MSLYRRHKPRPTERRIGRGDHLIFPAWVHACADWEFWFEHQHCRFEPLLQEGPRRMHPREASTEHERGVMNGPIWCVQRNSSAARDAGPRLRIKGRWYSARRGFLILYQRRGIWRTHAERLRGRRYRIAQRIGRYDDCPF